MSRPEIIKSPIISVVRSAGESSGRSSGHQASAARAHEAITTFAWNATPIVIVEQVEPLTPLDPRLTMLLGPGSPQAEAYRLLEHRLNAKTAPRVIAVTSAERGAGKTTCAANLALA